MNTKKNTDPFKTPSQDAQGPWHELSSPTQVLTGQQQQYPNWFDNNGNEEKQKKKKKCRGNRKAQHKRRRERRKQEKLNTIRAIANNNIPMQQEQLQNVVQPIESKQKSKNKRKRSNINQDDRQVHQSISQLSISQEESPKKRKLITTTEIYNNQGDSTIIIDNQQQEDLNEKISDGKDIKKFKPEYLKVSNLVFKRMLSDAIPDGNELVQCLNTDEKLQAIRHMTELMNNTHYFSLQRDLWQSYFNIGTQENIWTTNTSTRKTYFYSKPLIKKRQNSIANQLERTKQELEQYANNLEHQIIHWQPSIDLNSLIFAITKCIQEGQRCLKKEFEYKANIAHLELQDRIARDKFHALQPTEEQIVLTKRYWQVVANEQRTREEIEKLRKRIYLQRIPSKIDKLIDQSMNHLQPMLQILLWIKIDVLVSHQIVPKQLHNINLM